MTSDDLDWEIGSGLGDRIGIGRSEGGHPFHPKAGKLTRAQPLFREGARSQPGTTVRRLMTTDDH